MAWRSRGRDPLLIRALRAIWNSAFKNPRCAGAASRPPAGIDRPRLRTVGRGDRRRHARPREAHPSGRAGPRAWRVAAADQPRAAIAQTAEAGRGERPPRADRLRDRRRQNSRTLPGSHGARRASRAARRRAHRGSGRRHAAAPRGGRLRQAWRSVPILRCWRSSRPMSPFTPRCIACPATARSRTPSRRNGRI